MPVRAMRASELSQVQALGRKLWPDNPNPDFPNEHIFVWEQPDGTLAGFASVSLRPWTEGSESEPCPHVESWFVEAGLRHRGIGRALIEAIEAWCRDRGYQEVTSDTELDNEVSRNAHVAIGFTPTVQTQYFRKAIQRMAGQADGQPSPAVEPFHGSRSELRTLFAQADDSPSEIDSYLEQGEVLIARVGHRVVGHVQLISRDSTWEIKSLAVDETHRRQGIGSALVVAARARASAAGATCVSVATATADIANLRFYQRLGFRMERVQKDVFNIHRGYQDLEVDGIPVRDQIWFSFDTTESR